MGKIAQGQMKNVKKLPERSEGNFYILQLTESNFYQIARTGHAIVKQNIGENKLGMRLLTISIDNRSKIWATVFGKNIFNPIITYTNQSIEFILIDYFCYQ